MKEVGADYNYGWGVLCRANNSKLQFTESKITPKISVKKKNQIHLQWLSHLI